MSEFLEKRNEKIRKAYAKVKPLKKRDEALNEVALQFKLSKWTITEIVYPRKNKSKTMPKA